MVGSMGKSEAASLVNMTYTEIVTNELRMQMDVRRVLHQSQSEFQHIMVIETVPFGKALVMDGKVQSAQADEKIYHEALVHPAMLLSGHPKRVFIGGAGELATAREVLKHASVQEIVMVDIDATVVEVARKHMAEWGGDTVLADSRLTFLVGDAKAYLEAQAADEGAAPWDVIILDICDPTESGCAYELFTLEMFETVRECLVPETGTFVTQSGPGGILSFNECFTAVAHTINRVFSSVAPYTIEVPSFAEPWSFVLALNSSAKETRSTLHKRIDVSSLQSKFVEGVAALTTYDNEAHTRMFSLPRAVRQGLDIESRIISVNNPVFLVQSM